MSNSNNKLFNRDLSWLRFNHRVLQEAADINNPLYERIKFLAIFSSNLDEFFKVRVSSIRQIKELDKPLRKKLITKPNKLLKLIKKEVHEQQKLFGEIFRNQIIPGLKSNGIFLINHEQFDSEQKAYSKQFFESKIDTTQIDIDNNIDHVENEVLYLVALDASNNLVWVEFSKCQRFVQLPFKECKYSICFIEDIIKDNLNKKYKTEFYAIKVSRDADLYISNEYSGDLLNKIESALPKRDTGQVTRLLIDDMAPENLVEKLYKELDVNETDLVRGGAYHNFKDFFSFPNPTNIDLNYSPFPPKQHLLLESSESLFRIIRKKDQLLNVPYQSFDPVIKWVEEAAIDPMVKCLKITLYRVSKDSRIAKALLTALEHGKSVFAFIETKARFDEDNNIKWGKLLKKKGAEVKFSYPGIKVHSKIMYMEREENNNVLSYAYLGTGNFNEKTAKIYTDFALLTADERVTHDLKKVFQLLEGNSISPNPQYLLVSPFNTRERFKELVQREIQFAKEGKWAEIIIKMNSLQDRKMIKQLYKASNAGVKIRLLIRGICCLIPGVENMSENIVITSIVDRFLEHGRLYCFANDGNEEMYIGSADWMTRNLDHRIEVITPILDNEIKHHLKELLNLQLNDTIKARIIDAEQNNQYVGKERKGLSSQSKTYHWYS